MAFKGTMLLTLYVPICLVDDGLDMPSSIYDLIRAIKCVSVVFFWVKTSSTHNQSYFVDQIAGFCMLFLSANNQHKMVICPCGWK